MKPSVNFIRDYGDGNPKISNDISCYASVTQQPLGLLKRIILYEPLSVDFTEEEIDSWISQINEWGFKINSLGKGSKEFGLNDSYHVYEVPIYNEDGTLVHSDKKFLTTELILFRSLVELAHVMKVYFKLIKKYEGVDKFKLYQIAHCGLSFNSNHSLFDSYQRELISEEQFLTLIKNAKGMPMITSNGTCNVENFYRRTEIRYKLTIEKRLSGESNSPMKIFVVGGHINYAKWIDNSKTTSKIEDANLVMFTGGEDVNPALYGEKVNTETFFNKERDTYEISMFIKAQALKIPMLGICRGAQFLCVMSGGKLVQHQDNPNSIHSVTTAYGVFDITSTHHQAQYTVGMRYDEKRVIGYSTNKQSKFHLDGGGNELKVLREEEIVYYPKTRCLGIQGHPEMQPILSEPMYEDTRNILKQILQLFLKNKL